MLSFRTALLVGLASLFASSALAQTASFEGLGGLPEGYSSSQFLDASSDGSVAVGHLRTGNGSEAFRWTRADGFQSLGFLPGDATVTGSTSFADGVSADGLTIVGSSSHDRFPDSGRPEAVRWTDGNTAEGLGFLGGFLETSNAHDVSDDGSAIVGIGTVGEAFEGFQWTEGAGMHGIGQLPGRVATWATAVSGDGRVVVGFAYSSNPDEEESVRWTDAGGLESIGDLPGADVRSRPVGVSFDGRVIVGNGTSDEGNQAYIWTAEEGMHGLGDLPGGAFFSQAKAVSSDGTVVIGISIDAEGVAPFIWTEADGLRDLRVVLTEEHGADLTGWTNLQATALSGDGTVIFGSGGNPANRGEGWRADLGCGSIANARSRRACECTSTERLWAGTDGDPLIDSSSWADASSPEEDETAVFPDLGGVYRGLDVQAWSVGAIRFEGAVGLRPSGATLAAPCGLALSSHGDAPDGAELTLETHLSFGGDIRLPTRANGVAALFVPGDALASSQVVSVVLGEPDGSEGTLVLSDGGQLDAEAAHVALGGGGTGTLEVDGSELAISTVTVGAPGSSTDASVLQLHGRTPTGGPNRLITDSLIVGGGSPGRLIADGSVFQMDRFIVGADADIDITDALLSSTHTVLGRTGDVTARLDSVVWTAGESGTVMLAEQPGSSAEVTLARHTVLEDPLQLIVGGEGEARLRIGGTDEVSPLILVIGSKEGSRGEVHIDRDQTPSQASRLTTDTSFLGFAGTGTLMLTGTQATMSALTLGVERTGEGSLFASASELVLDDLTIGKAGRGDVRLADTSLVSVALVVIGDSTGGFGSVNVDVTSVLAADGICVGCGHGVGILGVDGSVLTDVLQIGRLGVLRGEENIVAVRRVTEPRTASSRQRNAQEPGIVTGALFLAKGSTVEVSGLAVEDGTLGGTVVWPSDLTNIGTVSPGDSLGGIGTFTVGAAYTQTGALEIDLGGLANHDHLEVTGAASLGGTLRLALREGYVPTAGDTYTVLTANSLTGTFATVEAPGGVAVELATTPTSVTVRVTDVFVGAEPDVPTQPSALSLARPIPNPSRGFVELAYELAAAGPVRLSVHDALGREVAVPVDGLRQLGAHAARLDASVLAPGIYLVRLQAGNELATQRLTVAR